MPGFNARKHRYKKVAKIDAVVPKINEIHKKQIPPLHFQGEKCSGGLFFPYCIKIPVNFCSTVRK